MFKFSRFARFARPSMARNPGRHQTNIQTRLMTKIYFGPGYGGRTTYNKYLWAFPIATFALGTWQVYRWRWKLGVIALREERFNHAAQRLEEHPELLSGDVDMLEEWAYSPILVEGEYLHDEEMHLYPRYNEGTAGYHVITPLRLADGRKILINRGWIPLAYRKQASRLKGLVTGPQKIRALVRSYNKPSSFTPPNEPQNNLWYWVDLPAMANEAGSLPFIADADKGQAPPGSLPEPGQTVVQIPNNHVNYIITWYLLTAFLAAMVYRFGKKPVRVPRHPVNKSK